MRDRLAALLAEEERDLEPAAREARRQNGMASQDALWCRPARAAQGDVRGGALFFTKKFPLSFSKSISPKALNPFNQND